MLGGCLETSDRRKVEHGGDRGGGRLCQKLRPGDLDRPMSCSGQGCARRGDRAGKVAGEDAEEAAASLAIRSATRRGDGRRDRSGRASKDALGVVHG